VILKTLSPFEVEWQGQRFKCAIGRSGIRTYKQEGDGATPQGCFRFQSVYYRSDRVEKPVTSLPVLEIQPDDGWCDDPYDKFYNQPVKFPCASSHEELWRKDHVYDLLITTDHNQNPTLPHKGSAIFIHIARIDKQGEEYGLTEGCLALALADLQTIISIATTDAIWIV
jgi:L,D-peptidoglycan transpeptidase YkuD (ErfK/YbiS/YcfS/YnhG family)